MKRKAGDRKQGSPSSLEPALELLSELLRDRQGKGAPRRTSAESRALRRLFRQAPLAMFFCDRKLRVTAWSPATERLLGIPASEAMGVDVPALLAPPESISAWHRELAAQLAEGTAARFSRVTRRRDASELLCDWQFVPLRDAAGALRGAAVLLETVSHNRFAIATESSGAGAFEWDLATGELWLSAAASDLLGTPSGQDARKAWIERVHEGDREAFENHLRAHLAGRTERLEAEHRIAGPEGDERWLWVRGKAERPREGSGGLFSGTLQDVTERRREIEGRLHAALHDGLTSLPGRELLRDVLKRCFARARRRDGYRFAILFVDVDRFKEINDSLGHDAGDEFLVQLSQRLQACLREGDFLGRYGGDEFTIVLDDLKDASDPMVASERIHRALRDPFVIRGQRLQGSVSIGVAAYSSAYGGFEEMLRDADGAMYRAKLQGRARSTLSDPGQPRRAAVQGGLADDLRAAVGRNELRLHYLPTIDLPTGRIRGLEALVRWAHPRLGLLSPGQFVPVAEATGLIVPIGDWVLTTAGAAFRSWRTSLGKAKASEELNLSINLSLQQIEQTDLVRRVDDMLEQNGMSPAELSFEVTARALEESRAVDRLVELKQRGVMLALDDVGLGSAAIGALSHDVLDAIKLDSSASRDPAGSSPIGRAVAALAHGLGKRVIAEGIETPAQLEKVRQFGVKSAQGFLFCPPIDSTSTRELLLRGKPMSTAIN